jgi:hypothetical protein
MKADIFEEGRKGKKGEGNNLGVLNVEMLSFGGVHTGRSQLYSPF